MKRTYSIVERKAARTKSTLRRVWDCFDANGDGQLEIVAFPDRIAVYDADGNQVYYFGPRNSKETTAYRMNTEL